MLYRRITRHLISSAQINKNLRALRALRSLRSLRE